MALPETPGCRSWAKSTRTALTHSGTLSYQCFLNHTLMIYLMIAHISLETHAGRYLMTPKVFPTVTLRFESIHVCGQGRQHTATLLIYLNVFHGFGDTSQALRELGPLDPDLSATGRLVHLIWGPHRTPVLSQVFRKEGLLPVD